MHIIQQAFTQLYPDKPFTFVPQIKYSRQFSAYNGNVRLAKNIVYFRLSKEWKSVDKEIKIGFIQELLVKLFGKAPKTINREMYNIFIKKVHITVPKTKSHPILDQAFERMNHKFFYNTLEKPNLTFGQHSIRTLGHYAFGSDTITISQVLKDAPQHLLDFVMYHEMLHKKLKFHSKNGRSHHHTKTFRQHEQAFPSYPEIENTLSAFVASRKHRLPRNRPGFWSLFTKTFK